MIELLQKLEYWHWLSFGFVLLILEMFIPGTVLMWMGISAIVVSIFHWIVPSMAWEIQLLLFGGLSLASFFVWRYWAKKKGFDDEDTPNTLNQRSVSLVGRKAILIEPIINGVGKVRLDDTFWRIEGEEMDKGTHVVVTGVNGATLVVEASKTSAD